MKNIFKLVIILLLLANNSCNKANETKKQKVTKNASQKSITSTLTNAKTNSEGTFIFSNNEETIINWTEWNTDPSQNKLKFSFYNKNTNKFDKEQLVTPALGLQLHTESMAKIGITKTGTLYAIYRKKSKKSKSRYGGILYYSISEDKGITWTKEKRLVENIKSTSQSFFDIALLPDGEIGIIWLDSRKPIHENHKGKTLYFAKSAKEKGFENEKPIAGSTCECCRTDIFVDKYNTIHIAYRNLIDPKEELFDGFGTTEIRDMYYLSSNNNGDNFTKPQPISNDNWHINGCPHTGPSLAFTNKQLGVVWFSGASHNNGLFFTTKTNDTFNEKKKISIEGRHPQMISLNNNFYVVYETYYEKDNKGYTKIILETIKNNTSIKKQEISDPKTNNSHAVISKIKNKGILISWVNENTRNPKIQYKTIY